MTTITRLLLLATFLLFSTFSFGQYRIYVNAAATGNNNGGSWYDAFTNLQTALIAAAPYGDEIWVAQGTYYPTPTTDRSIYFELKNKVKLYGGFSGVESQLSERDWTANETVLSGDIGVVGDSTDNSYNILFIGKSDTTTIVDGFVFRDGNADGPPNGSTPNQRQGAAIQILVDQFVEAYPKIHNCKFEHNSASAGGAVAILAHHIYGSAGPHFENCLFRYNSADIQGGAIFRTGHSSLEIKDDFLNCTFENNQGDAIYYTSYNPNKDIFEVVGCNFISNQGGGIRIDEQSGNKNEGKIEIRDCNFTGNERIMGAGISISAHPLSISIINSSFIGNSSTNILTGNGSAMVIQYNGAFPVGNDSFNLDISECIFKDNSSNYFQPIISLYGNGSDADVFTNLSFRDNLFEKNADGIVLAEFNSSDISNCIFEGNGTQEDRYILNGYQTDKTVVTNSIFINNKGILFREDNPDAIDTISNCTFYNNYSLVDTASSQLDGSAFILNCIFSQETQGSAFPIEAANVTLENSLILSPDCSALPAFVTCGPGNIFGLEPIFADTAAGDFHLLSTSPGTGAGDNDIVNELGILTDLDGNPRIQGGTVDMGAYESDSGSNNAGVKYVNTNVQGGNNDGTSWANAYLDLQDALAASQYGDEIWVAQGIYYPTATTDRNISFELKNGVKLYGGFVGTETLLSERDWVVNETVLSGDIGVLGDSTDNTYSILFIGLSDTTTIVDGFAFLYGNADYPINSSVSQRRNGAAIHISPHFDYAYPKILNCTFEHNYALGAGGAVYIICASQNCSVAPHFQNCLFQFNSAGEEGGAVYKYGHSLVDIKDDFLNCIFKNNSAKAGGAINYTSYLPKKDMLEFVGCNFVSNSSLQRGGGISLDAIFDFDNEEKIEIKDCNFINNECRAGAGIAMLSNPASLSITNSTFVGNKGTSIPGSFGAALAINYSDAFPQDTSSFDLDISECVFDNNNSNNSVVSLSAGSSANTFTKITFRDNLLEKNSTGMALSFSSSNITNCIFENNGLQENKFILTSYSSRTVVTNSIFSNNQGILYNQRYPAAIDTIANCTFYSNLGDTTSAQLFGNAFVSNCIFDQEIGGNAFPFQAANVTLENSLLLAPDCSNLPAYVNCGSGNLYGLTPVFADAAAGDFHLLPNSPGINAGNNDVVNALGIQTDYDGLPRIHFCNVDMGAFEASDYEVLPVSYAASTVCSGQPDGAVQFTLLNGCEPYSYQWTNGTATGVGNSDLMPGVYVFTITDALGKTVEVPIEVPAFSVLEATLNIIPYKCSVGTGGSVDLNITSGTAPYQVVWNDGSTDFLLEDLLPGTYTATVTDANGCSIIESAVVGKQTFFPLGINIHPITCPGDSDGSATLQPISGIMPYTWLWQSGETVPTIDSLSGGTYAATVTDAIGCTGYINFTITPPTPIGLEVTVVQPACFGDLGSATAIATGGTGNFQYNWGNGITGATALFPEGFYVVLATDANGCTGLGKAYVQAPNLLEANVSFDPPVLCHGASNGNIAGMPTGGTPPYAWSGPLENLSAGTYTVTLTDANGCSGTATATLAELPEIITSGTIMDASSPTAADGSVHINSVTGGTGSGYTFLWNNGSTEQNLTGIPTGDYTVTVTDSQGCTGEFSFQVDFNSAAGEASQNQFGAAIVPNPSGSSGARLVLERPMAGLNIRVFDAKGSLVFAKRNDGLEYALPKGLAAGIYQVLLESENGTAALTWVVGE